MSFEKRQKIVRYLSNLNFDDIKIENNTFTYLPISTDEIFSEKFKIIYFFYEKESELFEQHKNLWNENKLTIFIAVNNYNSYVINVKQKPDKKNPTSVNIKSFNYGVNSENFPEEKIKELLKESIDNSYFWNFVIEKKKRIKDNEVDKDLLNNLVLLKKELLRITSNAENINLLILQCLFIKYLEDRGVFCNDTLLNALKKNETELKNVFGQIKNINGDLFNKINYEINEKQLQQLSLFFEHDYYEYTVKKQFSFLFPYKFDKIPIELISNVYEEFLSKTKKKSRGIYYTRTFVADFMLSHTVYKQVKENKKITVLDPACGSGIFLVQSYKAIIEAYGIENEYIKIDEKVDILINQIFGIDNDKQALQIAAFSLYLALLSTCTKEEITERIKKQKPMLPSMYGKNLQKKNTITDEITFSNVNQNFENFDCIVGNPPWGSIDPFNYLLTEKSLTKLKEEKVPEKVIYCLNELISNSIKSNHIDKELNKILGKEDKSYKSVIKESAEIDDIELAKERRCLTNKSNKLYSNVSDKQRSQCFLFRVNQWCNKNTTISFIVNNSVFLNENAEDFRREILTTYNIREYYDLSNLSKILFPGKNGSKEPASIIIMDKRKNEQNVTKYHTAHLTDMAKLLNLIHCPANDIKEIKQADLLEEGQDVIWKIFVNGNWDDYQLIKKKYLSKNSQLTIECRSGFKPKKGMYKTGIPNYKKIIEPNDFEQYHIIKNLGNYNWNQNFERKRNIEIFQRERILIPLNPQDTDKKKLRGIFVKEEIIHKHNILSIKFIKNNKYIKNLNVLLGILNSKFIGYYLNYISSQWKEGKRNTLRNSDIENLPFPKIDKNNPEVIKLITFVEQIQTAKKENQPTKKLEDQIDRIVFDLYGLLDFEKEIIREFYDVNVYRKEDEVKFDDLQEYVDKFRDVFSFILDETLTLNAEYYIQNIGTVVSFSIVSKENFVKKVKKSKLNILDIVKRSQLKKSYLSKAIKEEKVKIYTEENFNIIKSKYFKDWTVRQAMKDANEEIGLIVRKLPDE